MKKTIYIILAAVISATGLFALAFPKYISLNITSLIPVGVIAYSVYQGFNALRVKAYFKNGRLRYHSGGLDFKYSKNEKGEGNFEMTESRRIFNSSNKIMAYAFFIGAALNVPFILLFEYKIKLAGIFIMLSAPIIGGLISLPYDIKTYKNLASAEKSKQEQQDKELEEQKKKEEMGKWK